MKVVLVTGGFDPLHSGHVNYFCAAKELGDVLIVGINSDDWLVRKKGRAFMPLSERLSIIRCLKMIDVCLLFDDSDNTAIDAIKKVKELYPTATIIFANGGDRTAENIPEMNESNIEFIFGVGGGKTASSSDFLQKWSSACSQTA
jgi:D-beta-D-heptose 7-phosphate kinase/D-beta-D-heptose 1-phosphate adenosyltransferase